MTASVNEQYARWARKAGLEPDTTAWHTHKLAYSAGYVQGVQEMLDLIREKFDDKSEPAASQT